MSYEQDFDRYSGEADSEAEIPKAPGDACATRGCNGSLMLEPGIPASRKEPEVPAIVYCSDCGCEYLPDWSRINHLKESEV